MDEKILFRAEGIAKRYGPNTVLRDIDLDIRPGEVMGLIGENGAGKSTLLRILAGVEAADEGSMTLRGRPFRCRNMIEANRMGVGMVFQEQSLVRNLTVAQNMYLGREDAFRERGFIRWSRMNRAAGEALREMGLDSVDPIRPVMDLSFAQRQMVEIAKVFNAVAGAGDRALILLDEPTSVLNEREVEQLFLEVRRLRDAGNSVVFVSHRLDEVLEISDRIYVMKDGRRADCLPRSDADAALLYEKMVGRETTDRYFRTHLQTIPGEKVLLEVEGLSLKGVFRDVSFRLHEGEVLGVCGVEGSGKEALCDVLVGDVGPSSGSITIEGVPCRLGSPRQALRRGVLAIPKERRVEGMVDIMSVSDNIVLSNLGAVSRYGVISERRRRSVAGEWMNKLRIKCSGIFERMGRLSGGNAQKVVFARAMLSGARILILNHPTRGVDVGSKEEIYELIREMTARRIAVILLGDTLDECIGLSSRILVMKDGLVSRCFDSPADAKPSQVEIVRCMM